MIFKKEIIDYSVLKEDTLLCLLDVFKKDRRFLKKGFESEYYKGWHDRVVSLALDNKNKKHKLASHIAALGRAYYQNQGKEDIFTKSIRLKIDSLQKL